MTNSRSLALDVTALSAGYGRFDVVHDVALKVAKGEAVALLGPNGAALPRLRLRGGAFFSIRPSRTIFCLEGCICAATVDAFRRF
jgi:ABC-type Na+ transport system ATPase subunit NatA